MGSSPYCGDMMFIYQLICANPNTVQPKSDLYSEKKSTPLINLSHQQENQLAQSPSENQLYGGDEVPTRLDSEGMRISYDDLHEKFLIGPSTFY
jgi:hypothetical protein